MSLINIDRAPLHCTLHSLLHSAAQVSELRGVCLDVRGLISMNLHMSCHVHSVLLSLHISSDRLCFHAQQTL